MDRIDELERRLETVLEIIMDHFNQTDDRLQELEDEIEDIRNEARRTER